MNNEKPTGTMCKSDRSQRRACVHYHEKTGRCTLARDAEWSTAPPPDKAQPRDE